MGVLEVKKMVYLLANNGQLAQLNETIHNRLTHNNYLSGAKI
jgi:hypothetical protein